MINKKVFLIGSRKSLLAREQTKIVIRQLKKIGFNNIKVKYILSKGDIYSYRNFKKFGGKGLFTNELDKLLLEKKIDIAVHSSKDIPAKIHKGLEITGFLKREDARDVLITHDRTIKKIEDIPIGSSFGSSSPRRICYMKNFRPDIKIKNLRGNIDTRVKKIYEKKMFSTILAQAGINRLKVLNYDVKLNVIPLSKMLPAAGQGAIAIVQRKDNILLKEKISLIDHKNTRLALLSERALIQGIDGNCSTPIGVYAKVEKNNLKIKTRLYSIDGSNYVEKTKIANTRSPIKLGRELAGDIINTIDFKYNK